MTDLTRLGLAFIGFAVATIAAGIVLGSSDHRSRADAVTERIWHPWLRIERLIRSILEHRWDGSTWPAAKVVLNRSMRERREIRRAG